MTRLPPLLPEEAFARVVRLSRFDGLGVLVVAGLFAVMSALAGDRVGAMIGLLIAGAGAVELHGSTLLQWGESRGMNWLITSQLFLMITILGYCQYRLVNMDLALLRTAVTDDLKAQLAANGMGVDEFLRLAYRLTWYAVAVVTILYQGTMAFYYLRRRRSVARALAHDAG